MWHQKGGRESSSTHLQHLLQIFRVSSQLQLRHFIADGFVVLIAYQVPVRHLFHLQTETGFKIEMCAYKCPSDNSSTFRQTDTGFQEISVCKMSIRHLNLQNWHTGFQNRDQCMQNVRQTPKLSKLTQLGFQNRDQCMQNVYQTPKLSKKTQDFKTAVTACTPNTCQTCTLPSTLKISNMEFQSRGQSTQSACWTPSQTPNYKHRISK